MALLPGSLHRDRLRHTCGQRDRAAGGELRQRRDDQVGELLGRHPARVSTRGHHPRPASDGRITAAYRRTGARRRLRLLRPVLRARCRFLPPPTPLVRSSHPGPRSSGDRAPPSGGGSAGSNPAGGAFGTARLTFGFASPGTGDVRMCRSCDADEDHRLKGSRHGLLWELLGHRPVDLLDLRLDHGRLHLVPLCLRHVRRPDPERLGQGRRVARADLRAVARGVHPPGRPGPEHERPADGVRRSSSRRPRTSTSRGLPDRPHRPATWRTRSPSWTPEPSPRPSWTLEGQGARLIATPTEAQPAGSAPPALRAGSKEWLT